MWHRFWNWYSRNIEKSILITLIILLAQIPHFIWAGDAMFQSGYVFGVNPVTDFIFFGIDLLEVPLIIKTVVDFTVLHRKKKK